MYGGKKLCRKRVTLAGEIDSLEALLKTEFINIYGAQELIPRNRVSPFINAGLVEKRKRH